MSKIMSPLEARYSKIMAAYESALGEREPGEVEIFDLLPAIFAAVPDTNTEEIAAALECSAAIQAREADALESWERRRRNFHANDNAKVPE